MARSYTRTGDQGTTGLYGGKRIPKSHPVIAALANIQELNAILGVARSALDPKGPKLEPVGSLDKVLETLQHELFRVGADIGTPQDKKERVERIAPPHTAELERLTDAVAASIPELRSFVLPGGNLPGAMLYLGCACARRAEIAVVTLHQKKTGVNPQLLPYMNRLSSLLFVLARWANSFTHEEEKPPSYA